MGDNFLRDRPNSVLEKRKRDNKDVLHTTGTTMMENVRIMDSHKADRDIMLDSSHPNFVSECVEWFAGLNAVGVVSLSATDRKWRDNRYLLKDAQPWMQNGLKTLSNKVNEIYKDKKYILLG